MYKIRWTNYVDGPEWRAMMRYVCLQFPLARDSKLQTVTRQELTEMIARGEVTGYEGYWNENGGRVGTIHDDNFSRYTQTWEHVDNAKDDFFEGWNAHEKYLQMLVDWNDAITEEQWRQYGEKQYKRRLKKGDTPDNQPPQQEALWQTIDRLYKEMETRDAQKNH